MDYNLEPIAKAIVQAQCRVRGAGLPPHDEEHQLRGVRRAAGHLADELCDFDEEAIEFLCECGYGPSFKAAA